VTNQRLQKRVDWRTSIPGYLYIAPAFIVFAVFVLWPLLQVIQLSTTSWRGLGDKTFIGLENYQRLLGADSRFWGALVHNLQWLVAAITIPTVVALFLAILLMRSPIQGRVALRAVYFLPQIVSSVVVAVLWRWIYSPNFGALNALLESMGLGALQQSWLGNTMLALPALFVAWAWYAYGFRMVIFLAALQGIDESYYDSAKVDGANWVQQQWYVTLPMMRRALATVILLTSISAFQIFDMVFIMTAGGPGFATQVLAVVMYDYGFTAGRVGYGSAVAVVLGIIILFLSLIFLWVRRKLEEVE
jgi:raffinose/stachyose/melibiose transport system permease protein